MRRLVWVGVILGLVACSESSDGSGSQATDDTATDGTDGATPDTVTAPDTAPVDDEQSPDATDGAESDAEVGEEDDVAQEDTWVDPCPIESACDDGDPCTTDDVCSAEHLCVGTPMDCDDGLKCTTDTCEEGACKHALGAGFCLGGEPPECIGNGKVGVSVPCKKCDSTAGVPILLDLADGSSCNDGDACTVAEHCELGECIGGSAVTCFPNGDCTTPTCDPEKGCTWPAKTGPCSDGSACTANDTCLNALCVGDAVPCDDNDPCTADACDPKLGCVHPPSSLCDDGKPCTENLCAAGGVCSNPPFEGPCDDGDPCTTGETCLGVEGVLVCQGGEPTVCDDGSPCTDDHCEPGVGCVTQFADGKPPCFDGNLCTIFDTCASGLCIGTKAGCPYCTPPHTDAALRVVQMTFSTDGLPGSGLDLDGDPSTCAPVGNCSNGIDNAMAALAPVINGPINEAIEVGTLHYVVDLSSLTLDGEPFPFAVLDTSLAPSSAAASCDWNKDECSYVASQFSYDPDCKPYFGLPNGTVVGNTFKGGGPGYVMTMAVALSGVGLIPITLRNAQVQGVVITDPVTNTIKGLNGIFAGASPKQQLYDTIANLDDETLPIDKATVLGLIDQLLVNDIDLDGDGEDDSASVALRFVTIPANLE